MHEFRRHRAWCPQGRPPGRRRLDLATDHGAFPVWEWRLLPSRPGRPAHEAHVSIGPRHLGLSADLAAALQSWASADPDDRQHWREIGAALADRLAGETGAEVVHPPTSATGCGHCHRFPANMSR